VDFFVAIFLSKKKPKDKLSLKIPSKNQADKTELQGKRVQTKET
jgi:hypothetical protein